MAAPETTVTLTLSPDMTLDVLTMLLEALASQGRLLERIAARLGVAVGSDGEG